MNESVTKWLAVFEAAPVETLHDLVLGRVAVSAWSRASLREVFLEIFQGHAALLDTAVTGWLRRNLLKEPPDRLPVNVWASHTQDVFQGITGLPLPKVARLLRDRLRDFRLWLRPLRFEESLDPEAGCLTALAWADTNRHLDGMWRALALRREREPLYYTDIGLLGLRKTRDERGQLPSKAPFLLLATLIDLADTMPRAEWELTTRAILGGYHYSLDTWVREFELVLEARPNAKNGPKWLKKILPNVAVKSSPSSRTSFPAPSFEECKMMISEVRKKGPRKIANLADHLERHRAYANASGNFYFLVRTFNGLADAARKHDPDWAVERAEESLARDTSNTLSWNVLARCLWARANRNRKKGLGHATEDFREAVDLLWQARFRFPHDPFIRTELARFCRESGDASVAESILREAVAEFPNNEYCLVRLADTLLATGKSAEARKLLEQARRLFPNGHLWRKSLADVLVQLGEQKSEAEHLYQEAAVRGNRDAENLLKSRSWKGGVPESKDKAQDEMIQLPALALSEMRPAQRLGRALLFQWQAQSKPDNDRDRLFAEAENLLTLPDSLAGDCLAAFIEARGFLLLARGTAEAARAYFEQQMTAVAPRRPLGLRLGLAEARVRMGETLSDIEETELASFGDAGSILPLVLKVLRLLESTESDITLCGVLQKIYPRVRELTGMPASELGEDDEQIETTEVKSHAAETPDTMMAHLLIADVFNPAKVEKTEDLKSNDVLPRLRAKLKEHHNEIFSVVEKLALAA